MRRLIVIAATLMTVQGWCATAPAPVHGTPVVSVQASNADDLAQQGLVAMQESNANPSLAVDAAILFTQALKLYEADNNVDEVHNMHANIFWCKKRMNLDDLQSYLAKKGDDAQIKAALAKVDEIADKKVEVNEVGAYFERAQKFATAHPDDHYEVAIRYFEVAERFQGTELSLKAQRLSLDAQQQHAKNLLKSQGTLFTSKSAPADGSRAAIPSADAIKKGIASVRDLYKADYARERPKARRTFIAKLINEAKSTNDDVALRYALLREAADLAIAAGDFNSMLTCVDMLDAGFQGIDGVAEKKAYLGHAKTQSAAAQAMIQLFANPKDPAANTTAGKYFCFDMALWDLGVPLLSVGGDGELRQAAEMELAKPGEAPQQAEIGDRWLAVAKKYHSPQQEAILLRANTWYTQALPNLTGISKDLVAKHIKEIDDLLPDAITDFTNLTAKQWDSIKAPVHTIRTGTGQAVMKLTKGEKVRIVPQPADTWTVKDGTSNRDLTWQGGPHRQMLRGGMGGGRRALALGRQQQNNSPFNEGEMVWRIGDGKQQKIGVAEGEGPLVIEIALDEGTIATGAIRVKIIPLDEE